MCQPVSKMTLRTPERRHLITLPVICTSCFLSVPSLWSLPMCLHQKQPPGIYRNDFFLSLYYLVSWPSG